MKIYFEHNFEEELEYLIRDLKPSVSSIEDEIELNIDEIKRKPIPPRKNNKWKVLKQFDSYYPNGIVCARYISYYDRLVYEYYPKTREIIFTNCRGHYYRDKHYSISLNNHQGETKIFTYKGITFSRGDPIRVIIRDGEIL